MSRYLVACDAGGTMTDVIIVDEEGRSVIGKAPTSPKDESIGYMESFWEALEYMGISQDEGQNFGASVETAIYTGTSMLNTVINMSGYKTGILTTRGFEDIISQGRGKQTFIGAQWSEITHMQYRRHRIPLVPSQLSRGVTERIDMFGTPVIPHVWGSDVLIAVDMHLVSALPDLPGGLKQFEPMLEYDTTPNLFHEQLLTEPLGVFEQVRDNGGRVRPPEGPGIGIALDEDFVAKYRVA